MIGNFVLSLLASAFCASVVIGGQIKADSLNNVSVANITNVMVSQSKSKIIDHEEDDVFIPNINFGNRVSFDPSTASFPSYEIFGNYYDGTTYGAPGYLYADSWDNLITPLKNNIDLAYTIGSTIRVNNQTIDDVVHHIYTCNFKIASQYRNLYWNDTNFFVDGFEFKAFVGWLKDGSIGGTSASSDIVMSVNGYVLDSANYYGVSGTSFIGADITTYMMYMYDISIQFDDLDLLESWSSVQWFFELTGNWYCNYRGNAQYGIGYQNGFIAGYSNGYQEGLATAQTGNFHNLFNSIADTPLRFLYGLFNFDLFGLSMLVIVLTLLTGLIVFGIVKKFWK